MKEKEGERQIKGKINKYNNNNNKKYIYIYIYIEIKRHK